MGLLVWSLQGLLGLYTLCDGFMSALPLSQIQREVLMFVLVSDIVFQQHDSDLVISFSASHLSMSYLRSILATLQLVHENRVNTVLR